MFFYLEFLPSFSQNTGRKFQKDICIKRLISHICNALLPYLEAFEISNSIKFNT